MVATIATDAARRTRVDRDEETCFSLGRTIAQLLALTLIRVDVLDFLLPILAEEKSDPGGSAYRLLSSADTKQRDIYQKKVRGRGEEKRRLIFNIVSVTFGRTFLDDNH